jgi:hypothetical protein
MKLYELRLLIRKLSEKELGIVIQYVQRMIAARPTPARPFPVVRETTFPAHPYVPVADFVKERFGTSTPSFSEQMQEQLEPLPHDWNTVVAFQEKL